MYTREFRQKNSYSKEGQKMVNYPRALLFVLKRETPSSGNQDRAFHAESPKFRAKKSRLSIQMTLASPLLVLHKACY